MLPVGHKGTSHYLDIEGGDKEKWIDMIFEPENEMDDLYVSS